MKDEHIIFVVAMKQACICDEALKILINCIQKMNNSLVHAIAFKNIYHLYIQLMSNQKLLKHALVQSNMFNMFEQLLQLQKIIKKICYMCNQLSKLSDTLFKQLSKKYCPLCNILSDNLPKNVVEAMSTVQYQPCRLCNILLDKLPKNVVLHTTKSILA